MGDFARVETSSEGAGEATPQQQPQPQEPQADQPGGLEIPGGQPAADLPPKFNDPGQLAQSYQHLEARSTQLSQENAQLRQQLAQATQAQPPAQPPAVEGQPQADPAQPPAQQQPPQVPPSPTPLISQQEMQSFSAEIAQNGALGLGSYQALAQRGFTPDMVNGWIEGQKAIASSREQQMLGSVGGQEGLDKMVGWANQNWTPAEIEQFNSAANSGNPDLLQSSLQALRARYEREVGPVQNPGLLSGTSAPDVGPAAFRSTEEYYDAVNERDSRGRRKYDTDPAFRNGIIQRLSRSNIFATRQG